MPEGTRVAALFRGTELLHPSGSTTTDAGDILCVVGHEHDLPALGKLFSQAPQRGLDLRFFGDFVLEGDAQLGPVATLYGLKLGEEDGNQALGRFMAQQIGGQPVVGDRGMERPDLDRGPDGREQGAQGRRQIPEGQGKPGPGLFL